MTDNLKLQFLHTDILEKGIWCVTIPISGEEVFQYNYDRDKNLTPDELFEDISHQLASTISIINSIYLGNTAYAMIKRLACLLCKYSPYEYDSDDTVYYKYRGVFPANNPYTAILTDQTNPDLCTTFEFTESYSEYRIVDSVEETKDNSPNVGIKEPDKDDNTRNLGYRLTYINRTKTLEFAIYDKNTETPENVFYINRKAYAEFYGSMVELATVIYPSISTDIACILHELLYVYAFWSANETVDRIKDNKNIDHIDINIALCASSGILLEYECCPISEYEGPSFPKYRSAMKVDWEHNNYDNVWLGTMYELIKYFSDVPISRKWLWPLIEDASESGIFD